MIEFLTAIVATAMVLSAAYATLFTGLRSYRVSTSESESLDVLQRSMDRILDDLKATHQAAEKGLFRLTDDLVESEELGEIPLDSLLFLSTSGNDLTYSERGSDLAEIEYSVDLDPETPESWLLRRQDLPADSDYESGGETHLAGPRILGLNVEVWDGTSWVSEWDSETAIPQAVRITLYRLPDPLSRSRRLQTLRTTLALPRGGGTGDPSSNSQVE